MDIKPQLPNLTKLRLLVRWTEEEEEEEEEGEQEQEQKQEVQDQAQHVQDQGHAKKRVEQQEQEV